MEASNNIVWLDVAVVYALHAQTMIQLGDQPEPLRDAGGLEAAIMRPQMRAYYEGTSDIAALAAVLGVGISQAQAFLDGNKRTAYVAMRVFLDLNGFRLAVDPLRVAEQLEHVAEAPDRDTATAEFEGWLRDHVAPTSS